MEEVMRAEPKIINVSHLNLVQLENTFYDAIRERTSENIVNRNKNFQQGGELAWRYLDSFVKERYVNYSKHISKPALSRKGCSRLSPYLTYGNISMRMIYQYTNQHYENSKTNVRFSILYLDFTGIAILYKNLKMNVEWSLKM
jgi:deoxyribodipyrimidine photo-lyase